MARCQSEVVRGEKYWRNAELAGIQPLNLDALQTYFGTEDRWTDI